MDIAELVLTPDGWGRYISFDPAKGTVLVEMEPFGSRYEVEYPADKVLVEVKPHRDTTHPGLR